jgi:hypothetical protein
MSEWFYEPGESLNDQLHRLRKARAAGMRRVAFESDGVRREVEFKTDGELANAIADLERRIAESDRPAPRIVKIAPSKGI